MDPIIYKDFAEVLDLTARDGRRGQRILDVGEEIRRRYPEDWHQAHNGDPESGSKFVRRWAQALRTNCPVERDERGPDGQIHRARYPGLFAGVNGKRGGEEPSQDVLTFPVHNGGNRDTSNRFPRIVIADVIGGAGGDNPTLTLNDVSAPSQGRFLDPWGVEDTNTGGGQPPPPQPPPGPVQPPAPPVPPPTGISQLDRIESRLAHLTGLLAAAPPPVVDLTALTNYVDHMIGQGPDGNPTITPNHVTDIKQRIDALQAQLNNLDEWLRKRRALIF